jgi:hypothetical protein
LITKFSPKKKNYGNKKPYGNSGGMGGQGGQSGNFVKPSYYNSQGGNTERNISNNNSYYNNNNNNSNISNFNSSNLNKERTKYENYSGNNNNFSNNNNNSSSGSVTERRVFKNSQPRNFQDIHQDSNIDLSSPADLTRKVFVGEISKQTSAENERVIPIRNQNQNYQQDLDLKYTMSENYGGNAKTSRNYEPKYGKKTEPSTPSTSATTIKHDDLQRPVFTSTKITDGANFKEIKQDGDVKLNLKFLAILQKIIRTRNRRRPGPLLKSQTQR